MRACPPRRWWLASLLALAPLLCGAPAGAQQGIREEVQQAAEPRLTRAPVLLRFVEAAYPAQAAREGVEGAVQLLLEIDAAGRVRRAQVESSPHPALAQAAREAAGRFLFSPAEVDGAPAPVRIRYAYNFELQLDFSPRVPAWAEDGASAPAGSDVLVGDVREQGSRLPLAAAAVAIRALGLEVKAGARGEFGFPALPPGRYRVEALSPEHRPEVVAAEVVAGQQTRITFYLQPLEENPYETVVRGERRQTTVTRVTLRQKELTTVPGTFGDPIRVVENLPGVARVPYVGGALLIRGAAPDDSGVYLDGVRIPLIYHFLGGPSVLNPEFLDRIDYYPGNADVRYGRLIAGVVDVTTRSTFTEQWGGSADVNLINTALMLKAPVTDRVSVAGAVRRSYIDLLMPFFLDVSGRTGTTVAPVFYDYQLRVDVKLKGDDQLYFLLFGSDDAIDVISNEPDQDVEVNLDTNTVFHRVLAGWRWQISRRLASRMTPSLGIDYARFEIGDKVVDMKTLDFILREDLELTLRPGLTLRGGADLVLQRDWFDAVVPAPADYRNPGSGQAVEFLDEDLIFNIDQVQFGLGLYADAVIDLTDRLQLIPGVRADLFRYFGQTRLSVDPRATARYKLLPLTTLKAAAGMFSNPPNPREVNEDYGNPNLVLLHAVHVSAGFEQRFPRLDALGLDLQGFFIWRYNLPLPTAEVKITGDEVRPLLYTSEGQGYSAGMELMLKHDVTRHFYGWLSYTLAMSKAQREPGGPFVHFVFDQTHMLTLVASVRLPLNFEVGTRFRLTSGRWDTPVLGSVLDSDLGGYVGLFGQTFSQRLPLFHQLDLRVERTWFFTLWRLSVYLDVQNVYNAKNPEAILWDYRYKESGPLRGLPILPTLGVKGSF